MNKNELIYELGKEAKDKGIVCIACIDNVMYYTEGNELIKESLKLVNSNIKGESIDTSNISKKLLEYKQNATMNESLINMEFVKKYSKLIDDIGTGCIITSTYFYKNIDGNSSKFVWSVIDVFSKILNDILPL